MNEKWSAEQVAMMREMVAEGSTDTEIADALNEEFGTHRTGNGVALARRRTGTASIVRGAPCDPVLRSQVLTYLQNNRSIKWIATHRKVAVRVVWKMVRALIRDGLVERVGGHTSNVRYRVTLKWIRGNDDD